MGWIFAHKKEGESIKSFLEKDLNYHRDNGEYGKVLDCAVINLRTAYLAFEIGNLNNATKEIIGVVCALSYKNNDYHNFGFKDIDETMHPYYYDCPEKILKMLTPTENEHANKWRDKCWQEINRKKALPLKPALKEGMTIKFAEPVAFAGGQKESIFTCYNPRKLLFRCKGALGLYKLRRSTLKENEWCVLSC